MFPQCFLAQICWINFRQLSRARVPGSVHIVNTCADLSAPSQTYSSLLEHSDRGSSSRRSYSTEASREADSSAAANASQSQSRCLRIFSCQQLQVVHAALGISSARQYSSWVDRPGPPRGNAAANRSKPAQTPAGPIDAPLLTSNIKRASSSQQLLQLLQQHGRSMNVIHVAAAFAKLGSICKQDAAMAAQESVQQLLQLLEPLLQQHLRGFGPWALSSIIHACFYLQQAQTMQQLLPMYLKPAVLGDANTQSIANVIWACCKTEGVLSNQQLQQLLVAFCKQLHKAKPQEVANTLWAVAHSGRGLPETQRDSILAALATQLSSAVPLDLASTLVACEGFRHLPLQLFEALEQRPAELQRLIAAAGPQDLANIAWACASLGYNGTLPAAAVQQASTLQQQQQQEQQQEAPNQGSGRKGFDSQVVCNTCWAAAVLDLQQHVDAVLLLAQACTRQWDALPAEELHQLYQVHLWLQDCQLPAGAQGLSGVLTQQQLEQCRDSWVQQLTTNPNVLQASRSHKEVFAALQALPGIEWQQQPVMEQLTADVAYTIDIAAVTVRGVKLAIQVDGPWHFVTPGRRSDGPTRFIAKSLAARGYTVVSIPYWQWDEIEGFEAQQRYLLQKLGTLLRE